MILELDKELLHYSSLSFPKNKFLSFKRQVIAERKEELKAKGTTYFCELWIKEVLNKNTKTTMALEETIHYTIKNEWSEYAESVFNYEEPSALLEDKTLGLILKITTEGVK